MLVLRCKKDIRIVSRPSGGPRAEAQALNYTAHRGLVFIMSSLHINLGRGSPGPEVPGFPVMRLQGFPIATPWLLETSLTRVGNLVLPQ